MRVASFFLILLMCARGVCVCDTMQAMAPGQGTAGGNDTMMMHAAMGHGAMPDGTEGAVGSEQMTCEEGGCCCKFAALHQPAMETPPVALVLASLTPKSPAHRWTPRTVFPDTHAPPPRST